MTIENISSISMMGKFSSYYGGGFRSTPIDIKELLSGKTTFREDAFCEELYLKSIEFEVFIYDVNDEDYEFPEKAGVLVGRLFDIERCEEDEFDPLEVFDNVDQYTYEIYDMGRKHHEGILSDNIFTIDALMIYPEYRGKNVGTSAMHILADVIEAQYNLKVGCIILVPEPGYDAGKETKPDASQYEHYKTRCENFWERLGFKRLNDSPYWYHNADMKMLVNGEIPEKTDQESPSYELVAESATIYEFPPRNDKDKE